MHKFLNTKYIKIKKLKLYINLYRSKTNWGQDPLSQRRTCYDDWLKKNEVNMLYITIKLVWLKKIK